MIQNHILNDKQCRSRSVCFWRSQLIWIYTVFKGRAYLGTAGLGLIIWVILGSYAPPPKKWWGIMLYPLKFWVSVHLSVRPSIRPSVCPSVSTPTILLPATPPTVLAQSFSNFTGSFRMVWRYAYCFFRILKYFFYHIFCIFNIDFFWALILQKCIGGMYLLPATPPTVLGQSFSNLTGSFRMVWRYAYCFSESWNYFLSHFFAFST